jgi:hypothetical protein
VSSGRYRSRWIFSVFEVQLWDNSTTFDASYPLRRVAKCFHNACLLGPASSLVPLREAAKSKVGPYAVTISYVSFTTTGTRKSTSTEDFSATNIWSPADWKKETRDNIYVPGALQASVARIVSILALFQRD